MATAPSPILDNLADIIGQKAVSAAVSPQGVDMGEAKRVVVGGLRQAAKNAEPNSGIEHTFAESGPATLRDDTQKLGARIEEYRKRQGDPLAGPQLARGRVSSRPGHSDTAGELGTGAVSEGALLAARQTVGSRTQRASMRQRQGNDAPVVGAKIIRGEAAEKRSRGSVIVAKYKRFDTAIPLNKFTQQMQGGELQPVPKRPAPAPALKLDTPMPIWGS